MYRKDQLCFSCKNACGGCSWSKTFTPVDGWEAKECKIPRTNIKTYKIKKCPEYVFDGTCVRCVNFNANYESPEKWYKECPEFRGSQGFGDCNGFINIYFPYEEDEDDYDIE